MPPATLHRFADAQAPVIAGVERELRAGRKRTHWMWFVFPQLRGLGHSAMAERFGLDGLAEARAYLADPLLGSRLVGCTGIVNGLDTRDARAVFGSPDDMKFRSCMTLFMEAGKGPGSGTERTAPFALALDRFFGGIPDPRTLAMLGAADAG